MIYRAKKHLPLIKFLPLIKLITDSNNNLRFIKTFTVSKIIYC